MRRTKKHTKQNIPSSIIFISYGYMKKKQVISYILCIFTLVNMFAVVEGQLVQVQATDGTHCESSSIC